MQTQHTNIKTTTEVLQRTFNNTGDMLFVLDGSQTIVC